MDKSVFDDAAVGYRQRFARFLSGNKPFIVIWLALFFCVLGIGMVIPLLPVFAKNMGASGIWLGLIFSGFAFSQIPLMPIIGRLSDRFGKKLFLRSGLLIYIMSAAGYFWSPGYHELALFSVLSGVGAAMFLPTAASYVGDLAPYGYEGRYMGLYTIALMTGFGIGPLFGGIIHDSLGMDATFISMAMLSILSFVIVFFFLPGRTPSSRITPSPGAANLEGYSNSFVAILRDKTMQGIITFQLAYGLLFGSVLAFVGIWMTTVIDTSISQVGLALSARAIMTGTLIYPFGRLADRLNRVILASFGMVIVAIGTFSIPWLGSFALLLGIFMFMGAFESMVLPSVTAIAVEKGRGLGMGSVMGIFNTAMSLGFVTGAMVGGAIEGSMGIGAVFRFAAALGLIGVVVFNILMRRSTRFAKEHPPIPQPGRLNPVSEESADSPLPRTKRHRFL